MYKSFKLTKRYSISFETFPKTAKKILVKKTVYHTGIYKTTDEINEFDTYFFVLGTFRIMWYVQHKHKCGNAMDKLMSNKLDNTTDMTWDEYGNPNPIIGGGDNMNNNPDNTLNMTALRTYITMYLEDIDAYGDENELTEATNVLNDFVMYLKSMRGLTEGETDGEQTMIDYNAMEEEWEMDNYNEIQQ